MLLPTLPNSEVNPPIVCPSPAAILGVADPRLPEIPPRADDNGAPEVNWPMAPVILPPPGTLSPRLVANDPAPPNRLEGLGIPGIDPNPPKGN